MADPTKYTPSYSYSNWQASNPVKPLPAPQVDNDFANVARSINQAIDAIRDVRRSDGKLKNGIVGPDSLAPQLSLGFSFEGQWIEGKSYQAGDGVIFQNGFYNARQSHVSNDLNTPANGDYWNFLFSIDELAVAGALSLPSSSFTGDGATTVFPLTFTPVSVRNMFVSISGVFQNLDQYDLVNGDIVFDDPPPNGTKIEIRGFASVADLVVPVEGSVSYDSLDNRLKETVVITPERFGAKNDGVTPDDDAFDAAYAEIMASNGGTLDLLPGNGYFLQREHSFYPAAPFKMRWQKGARVRVGGMGVDEVLFNFNNPVDVTQRGASLTLTDPVIEALYIAVAGQVGPCLIEGRYLTDFKIEGFGYILHYAENTALRLSATFNSDIGDLVIFGAGHRKPWKVADLATRFSIAQNTQTLTSTQAVFSAGDVGEMIMLGGPVPELRNEMFTIIGYTNATTVTVDHPSIVGWASKWAEFQPARVSFSAGGTIGTMNKACLVAGDVGRVVYVVDARDYGSGSRALQRAKITEVISSTQLRLDTSIELAVTNTFIVFSPAVELYGEVGEYTNDLTLTGLHVEQFRGTGMVVSDCDPVQFTNLKIHAQNPFVDFGRGTQASDFQAIFSNCVGYAKGVQAPGVGNNSAAPILVCGNTAAFKIEDVLGKGNSGQPLLEARNNSPNAQIEIGTWTSGIAWDAASMAKAFRNTGPGRLSFTGKVTARNTPFTYPQPIGPALPSTDLILSGTETILAKTGNKALGLAGPGRNVVYGVGVSGTVETPGPTVDFQQVFEEIGISRAPNGALLETSRIAHGARNPSGGNVEGVMDFYLRNAAGNMVSLFSFGSAGVFAPTADAVRALGLNGFRFYEVWTTRVQYGNGVIDTAGSGSPEGAVTASPGSTYRDFTNGKFYVKETGTGTNTGWVMK